MVRPLNDNIARTHWNTPKRCRSLSLSDEAWDIVTRYAVANDLNRSEVIERLIRRLQATPDMSNLT